MAERAAKSEFQPGECVRVREVGGGPPRKAFTSGWDAAGTTTILDPASKTSQLLEELTTKVPARRGSDEWPACC